MVMCGSPRRREANKVRAADWLTREELSMAEIQRVAIVTGAAGGIGRAMVRGLLAADIRVAGVDRDRDPLGGLAAVAREQGKADELITIQTDLTSDTAD